MDKLTQKLKENNIQVFGVQNKQEVVEKVKDLIEKDAMVSCGGSMSLMQSKIMDLLKNENYRFLDRSTASNPEEIKEIYNKSYSCDVYLTSANAITENGEIYNVDGNGNRVSANIHGPNKVIYIIGKNKIVKDMDEAIKRLKTIASPLNAKRLNLKTPCATLGHCVKIDGGMTEGCNSDDRICIHHHITSFQRNKDRVKVILVDEKLGY